MLITNKQLALPSIAVTASAISKAFLGIVSDYDTCRYSASDIYNDFTQSRGCYKEILENIDMFVNYLEQHDFDLHKTKAPRLEPDEDEDEVVTKSNSEIEEDEVIFPTTFEELRRSDFIKYIANEAYNYMYSSDGPFRTAQRGESVQLGYKDSETGEYTHYVDIKEDNSTFTSENEEACKEAAIITVRQLCDMSMKLCCNLMDVIILKAKYDRDNLKVNHEYFAANVRRWRPPTATSPGVWFPYSEKSGYRNAQGFREGYGYVKGEDTLPNEVLDMFAQLEMICATMNISLADEDPTPYTKEGLPISVKASLPKNLEYCAEVLKAYSTMSLGANATANRTELDNAMDTLNIIGPRTLLCEEPLIIENSDEIPLEDACEFASRVLNANIKADNCQYVGGVLTTFGSPLFIPGVRLGLNTNTSFFVASSGLLIPYFSKVVPKTFQAGYIPFMLNCLRRNYSIHQGLWYTVE